MLDDLRVGALYGLLVAMAAIAILCGGTLWYCLHMPGRSHSGDLPAALPEEIDLASHLRRHVIAIASRPHKVRHYEALEGSAVYIEQHLVELGYKVTPQTYEVHDRVVRNLVVTIAPAPSQPSAPSHHCGRAL
jgi:hypothetical protein